MKLIYLKAAMMALTVATSWAQTPSPVNYTVDAGRSKIEVFVFRGGILKVFGHDHVIAAKTFSGKIRFNPVAMEDSSVSLSIESASLIVLEDPNESEKDRKEVQATMQSGEVLNIKEFPTILFQSTGVKNVSKTGEDFTLTGKLRLHGTEKEITFPVHIHPEGDLLRTTGTAVISQIDFGIKPVKAAGGTVRVKDQIKVTFDFLAEKEGPWSAP